MVSAIVGATRTRAATLNQMLDGCRLARSIHVLGKVGSTNDEARRHGREGRATGLLVVADRQEAGRGRQGRRWHSPPGSGVYMSVLLRPPPATDYAAALQLAAGVAVAEALARYLPDAPELLWPNDCYCRGGKIAGVLVEAEATRGEFDFLVCGIGINVNQARADFDPEIAASAVSVRSLTGSCIDRDVLAAEVLFGLEAWDDVARARGLRPVIDRFEQLSPSTRGAAVAVQTTEGLIEGTSAGLSDGAGLRVAVGDHVHDVRVGELVRVHRRSEC